jgi:hypothetical protein
MLVVHLKRCSRLAFGSSHFDGVSSFLMAARCRALGPRRQPIMRKKTTEPHPTMFGSPRQSALAPASEAYVNTMPLENSQRDYNGCLVLSPFNRRTGTTQSKCQCSSGQQDVGLSPDAAVHAWQGPQQLLPWHAEGMRVEHPSQ